MERLIAGISCIILDDFKILMLIFTLFFLSGNGVCLTLSEMAQLTYGVDKNLAGFTYTTPWDAK